jgi:tetratricopeptide (TPR) repeat protein
MISPPFHRFGTPRINDLQVLVLPSKADFASYTQTITPAPPATVTAKQTTALVIFWLTLVIAIAGFAGAWSNHFGNGFHLSDFDKIVRNPGIRSLFNIPRFFIDPQLFSSQRAHAAYQPFLSTVFSLTYVLRGHADPALFQFQIFVWFVALILLMYALFRLIPGGDHYSALFAATLYSVHPLAADSLNDPVELGMVFGLVGLLAGLCICLVWPQRLPDEIRLGAPKVPKSEWDLFRLKAQPRVTWWYNRIRRTRVALYLIPVGIGLLAFPATAVFAPLLALYAAMFEPEKGARRARFAGIICGGYWLLQLILTWKYGAISRLSLLDYWFTQPLVVLRSLYLFFVPIHMNGISTLRPVEHFWSPLAIAGDVTVAGVVYLAFALGRKSEWRTVAFGLWWFLVAMAPSALVPQAQAESFPRIFFACAGLVLAVSRTALLVGSRFTESRLRLPVVGVGLVAGLAALAFCAQETWQLNEVWKSDETLWKDMVARNPNDGPSLVHYGRLLLQSSADDDFFDIRLDQGYGLLKRAAVLLPHDPEAMTGLALASEQKSLDADAAKQYVDAIRLGPSYSPAYAYYSRWLLRRQKLKEAMDMAMKAIQIDPTDLVARQAIADIYITQPDWKNAIESAAEVLRLDPDSEDGSRSLKVAQAGLASLQNAESAVAKEPSVENYLALSVTYFNEKRYDDCVHAAQQVLKVNPNIAEAYVNMATAYHALGKADEGIAALREAARLRPDFNFVTSNLAWELAHKNENGGQN